MYRFGQFSPSDKILDLLVGTLSELQGSPDLAPEDARWLRRFGVHLIAEYSVVKEAPVPGRDNDSRMPSFGAAARSM